MSIVDIIPYLIAVVVYYTARYFVIKYWPRWEIVEIFINPETKIVYEIKERNGKYRYYIFGIRVPEKLYDWL